MLQVTAKNHQDLLTLIIEISRAVKCCQQEAVFCEDVTFYQFLILESVGKAGKLKLSSLHGILAVEKSTTTRMVAPLVKRGLVVREKARKDSRAVKLCLTKEGAMVREKVWDCLAACLDAIENQIPEARRKAVYEDVRLFSEALQKICGDGRCASAACKKTGEWHPEKKVYVN